MTPQDLEAVYKQNAGASHADALHLIYLLGVVDGAGQTRSTATPGNVASSKTAPTAAEITNLKKYVRS